MRLFRRKPPPETQAMPRHVEVWADLEANNRFLRRLLWMALAWAFAALAAGSYGLLTGLYRPLAFFVSPEGRAELAGHLAEREEPSEVEVRYVAKEFLKHFIGFSSASVEDDLAYAWNLMTEDLRARQSQVLSDYEKEHGEELVSTVKREDILTTLDFPGDPEVRRVGDKGFMVRLKGSARSWPAHQGGERDASRARGFDAVVTLLRCPRTESFPNGLLVANISTRFIGTGTGTVPQEESR